MAKIKAIIMAGGTGGHIFPALAVAEKLKKKNVRVFWLGSITGMENNIVPKYNYPLYTVNAVGLRGKKITSLIKAPIVLTLGFFKTLKLFLKLKPDVALGMGGFISGIGGIVAKILNIPLIIQEQNAIAGTSNKILTKFAKHTFQAFDNTFINNKNVTTSGNPVFFKAIKKEKHKGLNLLILGGSLGAKPINDIVIKLDLDINLNINIWHQCGKLHIDNIRKQYKNKTNIKISAFIDDMAYAYAWADIVLCRAGAMTISELMLSGSASILVPLPHAIDNHQMHNANILVKNNAAILIAQNELSVNNLTNILKNLKKDVLITMGHNANILAKPNAAKDIAQYIIGLK